MTMGWMKKGGKDVVEDEEETGKHEGGRRGAEDGMGWKRRETGMGSKIRIKKK